MIKSIFSIGIFCVLSPFAALTAQAYPVLEASSPGAGTTVNVAPAQIKMDFSDALVARFSGIELSDAQGRTIDTGQANLDPTDDSRFAVTVKPRLPPGSYIVVWHAGSADTRRVAGNTGSRSPPDSPGQTAPCRDWEFILPIGPGQRVPTLDRFFGSPAIQAVRPNLVDRRE
jgi:methionine-rich copper-binding protein CopC